MKVRELVEAFGRHTQIQNFVTHTQNLQPHIAHLEGLIGSSAAVAIANIFFQTKRNILIVLPESEEAEFLRSDLEHLISENEILYLPHSYKRPFEFQELSTEQIQHRAEVISRLQHTQNPHIIIATAESISEKVISNDNLQKKQF